jgi:hypothetical protein
MIEPIHLLIRSQPCWLSPARCLFWEEKKTLVVGGFQLGRISEPTDESGRNSSLDRLQEQILFFKAERVLFLGAFPLPESNQYLEAFTQWRKRYPALALTAVLSHESPVAESLLNALGVSIHIGQLKESPFVWTANRIAYEEWEKNRQQGYLISGFQDPGYKSYDAPRQATACPTFFLTPDHALLPAFSKPKGTDRVRAGKDQLLWLCHAHSLERKT